MSAAAETQSGNWCQKTPFAPFAPHPGGRVPERGGINLFQKETKQRICKQ